MKQERDIALRALSACALFIALFAVSSAAQAQAAAPAEPVAAPSPLVTQAQEDEPAYEPLQVGDATQGLLAWQRSGDAASKTPRPIAGPVAHRSYERYLKSFEFAIPEHMSSSIKASTGSGSAK